ncbi:MAG TPA: hypothetical protein VK766_05845 [Cytophagaceae bacterium]|nr:hypothetical protein [Cytophagaceae bacterium]
MQRVPFPYYVITDNAKLPPNQQVTDASIALVIQVTNTAISTNKNYLT